MIDGEIAVLIDQTLSPAAQARMLAEAAIQVNAQTKAYDEELIGHSIIVTTTVDGVRGASEYTVHANGTIIYEYPSSSDVVQYIAQQLEILSPVGSGRDKHGGQYKASHKLFADGVEIAINGNVPFASEYLFISQLPYSRKIEAGESSQASSGVYELVANQAAKLYGNVAHIEYEDVPGPAPTSKHIHQTTSGFPAIRVTLNGR